MARFFENSSKPFQTGNLKGRTRLMEIHPSAQGETVARAGTGDGIYLAGYVTMPARSMP